MFTIIAQFFINDTPTTHIYTLSLHDALPIYRSAKKRGPADWPSEVVNVLFLFLEEDPQAKFNMPRVAELAAQHRSEEHTSELQSHSDLVCRLLLEKKKKKKKKTITYNTENNE